MDFPKSSNMKFQKISQTSDSDDDDVMDLSKPVNSLSTYVDDEEELVSQMFKALKMKKIKSMLPPVLRNAPMADIQKLFVQELTGMSRTRILASINGDEVHSSSSDSDLSDLTASSSEGEDESPNNGEKSPLNNFESIDLPLQEENSENKGDPSLLTTLDLIELEMRAKLIKTMLEKHPNEDPSEALENYLNVKIKQEPLSPDLLAGLIKKEKITPENSPRMSNQSSSSDRSRGRSKRKRRSASGSSSSSSSSSKSKSRSRSGSRSSRDSLKFRPSHSSSSSSSDDSAKKSSGERSKGKRKLTRKQFEERMKKAKMNRSYRKREDSDQDSFDDDDDEEKKKQYKKWKAKWQKKHDAKTALWEKKYFEGLKKETETKKTDPEKPDSEMEEGEVLEKEEGEVESNEEAEIGQEKVPVVEEEEEEGACTPSDQEDVDQTMEIPPEDNLEKLQKDGSKSATEEISTYSEKVSRRRTKKDKKSKHRGTIEDNRNEDITQQDIVDDVQSEEIEEPVEEIVLSTADENSMPELNMTLPSKSDRQSISFSLLKKNLNAVKDSDESEQEIETRLCHERDSNILRHFATNENIEIVGEESDKEVDESNELNDSTFIGDQPTSVGTPEEGISTDKHSSLSKESITGSASAENSCDANVDIIGFIEPKVGRKESDPFDEDFVSGSSWSSRWLQSEKVQTVVSDSKIMSKVRRKKIQAKGKIEKSMVYSASPQPAAQPLVQQLPTYKSQQPVKPVAVIGSFEEYEKTVGVKLPAKSSIVRKLPAGLDSGDSEDSEEEALWSKIMKK